MSASNQNVTGVVKVLSEIQNYLHRIENLRGQIRDLIAGLPEEALNWRPTEEIDDHATNSLAVLAAHVAGAEHFWMTEVVGGRPPTRNREAEFVTRVSNSAELHAYLDKTGQETRELLSDLDETELSSTRKVGDRTVYVRWAILHAIDHAALHLGHMQITYQLWMGGRGVAAPRWFERLPEQISQAK